MKKPKARKNISRSVVRVAVLATITLSLLVGCGKQAYVVTSSSSEQKAPGTYFIPPKVDILLAEDDTGSMYESYEQISKQMPIFLNDLQSKNWDYHFVTIPLTNKTRQINEVLASKYDSNWGASWQAPHPGSLPGDSGMVASFAFRRPENYTSFLTTGDISNGLNGSEPGLESILDALENRLSATNFLRKDAMLMILVVGNGEDTSGVTMCRRIDNYIGPCEDVGYPAFGTKTASFEKFRTSLIALKKSTAQLKFFSAVAKHVTNNCLGGRSLTGTRYIQMATALGGQSYDVCSQSISSVFSELSGSLQAERKNFRTKYLFVSQNPDVNTIQVVRYIDGDPARTAVIPQSAVDGWTFEGHLTDVYAIDDPVPMNLSSGYAIELHGVAKLIGSDTANVTFKPAGAQNAVAR